MGGRFHLKLNTGERPIANKYREGKMKRTLKRELKVLEIAKREALETSHVSRYLLSRRARVVLSRAQAGRCGSCFLGWFDSVRWVRINYARGRKLGKR
jgi:hypothetical protein